MKIHEWINYKDWVKNQKHKQLTQVFGRVKKWSGIFSMDFCFNERKYIKLAKNNHSLFNHLIEIEKEFKA